MSVAEATRPAAQTAAKALGWLSLALGAAEIFGARRIDRTIGTHRDGVTRAFGLREIVTGMGILASRDSSAWLWGRVVGDIMDLAALAPAVRRDNPQRSAAITAFANVAAVTLIDVVCAAATSRSTSNEFAVSPRRQRV